MTTFNSLGSNHTFVPALKILFSFGRDSKRRELLTYLEKRYGGRATLTYKGRDALLLGLRAIIGDKAGAMVAINGFTCIALHDAVVDGGYTPIFLDIAEDGLDFSAETLRAALETNANIKAVVIQNTLGYPCNAQEIAALCKERGIALIEDLAHSIGAVYEDGTEAGQPRPTSERVEAGTLGDAVILSFSQDKVIDSVSGGALVMRGTHYAYITEPKNTPSLGRQAKERLYPITTWKIRFWYRFGIGKFLHTIARALHLLPRPLDGERELRTMPSWQAGIALSQFKELEYLTQHRRRIAHIYAAALDPSVCVRSAVASIDRSANLRFPIIVHDRNGLITYLRTRGIHVSDIWYDAPIAPRKYIDKTSYRYGTCPNAEGVADTIVNLPTHINVSSETAKQIADEVHRFLAHDHGTRS